MPKKYESKSMILEVCRQLIASEGIGAINMRKVASLSNLAIGSLYYYFPSKDDLLIASIESVWEDIFKIDQIDLQATNMSDYIRSIHLNIKQGMEKYPNFLSIHSISFSSKKDEKARLVMRQFLDNLKKDLVEILINDKNIKASVFDDNFTKEEFAEFILANIITILLTHRPVEFLIKTIEKILY